VVLIVSLFMPWFGLALPPAFEQGPEPAPR
jgi:hypothetical protein